MLALWNMHLCLALVVFLLLPLRGRSRAVQFSVLLILLGLGFASVQGLPLVAYPRALVPEVSIVTLLGLGWAALVRMNVLRPLPGNERVTLLAVLGALGLFLYPAALGLGAFDSYQLGFGPRVLLIAVGLVALVLVYFGHWLVVAMFAMATLAFSLGVLESENYWDYLLDPFVVIYCWAALLARGIGWLVCCAPISGVTDQIFRGPA